VELLSKKGYWGNEVWILFRLEVVLYVSDRIEVTSGSGLRWDKQ